MQTPCEDGAAYSAASDPFGPDAMGGFGAPGAFGAEGAPGAAGAAGAAAAAAVSMPSVGVLQKGHLLGRAPPTLLIFLPQLVQMTGGSSASAGLKHMRHLFL